MYVTVVSCITFSLPIRAHALILVWASANLQYCTLKGCCAWAVFIFISPWANHGQRDGLVKHTWQNSRWQWLLLLKTVQSVYSSIDIKMSTIFIYLLKHYEFYNVFHTMVESVWINKIFFVNDKLKTCKKYIKIWEGKHLDWAF